jgi:hypothetical protein
MADECPPTTAVVFSCDDAYFFLARGLVMSLADVGYPSTDTKLFLIDIGCGPDALAWMKDHGVEILPFDPALIPQRVMAVIRSPQRAQVGRPWIPDMLPQFDHLIWLDCDLWLQNGDLIRHLKNSAREMPDAVTMAPGTSHYNTGLLVNIDRLLHMQHLWFGTCYEGDLANHAMTSLHFSSGVFGMRRSSPIWQQWRKELEHCYPRVAERFPNLLHLAEQIALNIAALQLGQYVRLDPLYNFHCNGGGAVRLPNGIVMTNLMLPPREIGVVHLANWSFLRKQYVSHQLLYRCGDYLSPAEMAMITQ